ncbi:MAG: DMT family transporter [Proteobacteria bacterium]|uniref:DMT family transporter n=1 Tax=Candidatus Avisuccinivibrio stercorigallinarum TaxID=2840704 RepID=A0A9D9DF09_9GAMM|nr:DMT family transporter [Candidatus Avisuccinivibrio stercorigallinarum]
MQKQQQQQLKGSIAGMLSAAFYGCSPALALSLYALNFDAANALFYRYFGALLLLIPLLVIKRESFLLPLKDLKVLAVPGIFFALSTLTYFISFAYMNAGISATIMFLYPVFTALIMVLVYHEKISLPIILAIVLSFAGVLMLYQGDEINISAIGCTLAVASAVTYAIYIVGINRTHLIISNDKLTLYLVLFSVLTTAIYMVLSPSAALKLPAQGREFLYIGLLALVPTIFSLELLNVAINNIGSTATAVLGALEPVTAVALAVIFFDDPLSFNLVVGIALILGGVLMVIAGSRFKARRARILVKRFNFIIRKSVPKRWRWKS